MFSVLLEIEAFGAQRDCLAPRASMQLRQHALHCLPFLLCWPLADMMTNHPKCCLKKKTIGRGRARGEPHLERVPLPEELVVEVCEALAAIAMPSNGLRQLHS